MTVDDVKKIFFPVDPPPAPKQFLDDLPKNEGENYKRLFELFGAAFSTIEDDIKRKYAPNEIIAENQDTPNEIIAENQGNPNLNNVEKLNKYERSGSIENTKEYNDEVSAVQKITEKLYSFLIDSLIWDKSSIEAKIKLWNYYRQGLAILSESYIRKRLEKKIDDFLDQPTTIYSIWWYAIKQWRWIKKEKKVFTDKTDKSSFVLLAIQLILRIEIPKDGVDALYYTSLSSLKYIFSAEQDAKQEGTLLGPSEKRNRFHPSIMSVSTMNDPEEGHILQEYLDEENKHSHRYWWNLAPAGTGEKLRYHCIEPYVFCKSFTNEDRIDDLSMWEVYGDRSEGACCIIKVHGEGEECLYHVAYFSRDEMKVVQIGGERRKEQNESKFELLDVLLSILKEMVEGEKDKEKNARKWRDRIMGIAYLFKYESYSHENEMRFLYSLIGAEANTIEAEVKPVGGSPGEKALPILSVTAQISFEFIEVILGPKVKNPDNAAAYLIHQFKIATGNDSLPRITKSAIRYR